ncbi:MAG: hypothetical protein V4732_18595 [Pseudomonadota bacterium]
MQIPKVSVLVLSIIFFITALASPAFAKTIDLSYGTIEIPDDFVFTQTGTTDSFMGTLVRKSDNFVITFDIGIMAGTHMHESKKGACTFFRHHTIGAFPAITGIETIAGKRKIVTTTDYDPKTQRVPANFWAIIKKDSDIADFLIIVASYKPNVK